MEVLKTCVLMVVLFCAVLADEQMSAGGFTTKVLGKSGKIQLTKDDDSSKKVTLEFDYLKEVDEDGNAVGTSGQEKHSFNTFASQDFTFSPMQEVTYQSVATNRLRFQATLFPGQTKKGIFTVDLYVFKEDGTLDEADEEVSAGDLKFNLEVSDWIFCGCTKGNKAEEGKYIEAGITVKGSGTGKVADDSSNDKVKFYLGETEYITLVNKIKVDGEEVTMKSGFPKVETQGSKQTARIMIPKMNSIAVYDPIVRNGAVTTVVLPLMITAMALIARIFN